MATQAPKRITRKETTAKQFEQYGQNPLWKCLCAELVGTFFLTFAAAAPIVVGALTGQLQNLDKVVAPGATVAALIYALGPVSGAHFNPAVTLAFATRRAFPIKLVPLYWISQIVGSVLAATAVFLLFGATKHVGATTPDGGIFQSMFMEMILTTLLCMVILGTSNDHKLTGNNAALAVGGTIALCGMIGGPISGASMNPARSLGPAILGGTMSTYWIYLIGPAMGALIAVVLTDFFHSVVTSSEQEAAMGQKNAGTSESTSGKKDK